MKTLQQTVISKTILSIAIVILSQTLSLNNVWAQNVGINNANPNSKAMLDITSNDKGILIPRMTGAQRLAIFPAPDASAKGMLVFQTDNPSGFYFYDGTAWNFLSNAGENWSVNGNYGTNTTSNFLGTTDSTGLSIRTNNTEKMRLTPNGRLGIGNPNPETRLSVYSNDSAYAVALFRNQNHTGYSGQWFLSSYNNNAGHIGYGNISAPRWAGSFYSGSIASIPYVLTTANQERLRIDPTGNIGIDTIDPKARLHAVSNGNVGWPQLLVEERDSADWARITFKNGGSNNYWTTAAQNSPVDSITSFNIYHNTIGNMLSVRGNGKVAIGWHDPKSRLHVARNLTGMLPNPNSILTVENNDPAFINVLSSSETGILFGANGNSTNGAIVFNNGGAPDGLQFRTNGNTTQMTLTNTGNLGIGVTNPSTKLHVVSTGYIPMTIQNTNASGYSGLHFMSNSNTVVGHMGYANSSAGTFTNKVYAGSTVPIPFILTTADQERVRIDESGNVGIGTQSPSSELEVNGYTKLGSDAPAIKMKKLTGTTAVSQGSVIAIAHGLNLSKIISVEVMVDYSGGSLVHPSYTVSGGYEFNFYVSSSSVHIANKNSNSFNILNKPVKIIITYEE